MLCPGELGIASIANSDRRGFASKQYFLVNTRLKLRQDNQKKRKICLQRDVIC